jgi:hypothetical protein
MRNLRIPRSARTPPRLAACPVMLLFVRKTPYNTASIPQCCVADWGAGMCREIWIIIIGGIGLEGVSFGGMREGANSRGLTARTLENVHYASEPVYARLST